MTRLLAIPSNFDGYTGYPRAATPFRHALSGATRRLALAWPGRGVAIPERDHAQPLLLAPILPHPQPDKG
jgi:hypothetical protein